MQVLRDCFSPDNTLLDVPAHDLPTAFRVAVEHLVDTGRVDAERAADVQTALLRREAEASTAIGHAVAVPHVYLDAIKEPVVLFVRLEHPINLGAPDGVPTQHLFFLLGPPNATSAHLDTLASVARLMADDEFRYEVGKARTPDDLAASLESYIDRNTAAPEETPVADVGLEWTGRFAGGLRQDVARKRPWYVKDFVDGLHAKCVGSAVFLFFACLAPALTFGGLLAAGTGNEIGTVEIIVGTALSGVLYALLGGQPLIILGFTGPVLVLTVKLYELCQAWDAPFLPTYGWVGLWAAGFLLLMSVLDASFLMKYFTRFTDEIFSALMSLIFIHYAIVKLADEFQGLEADQHHDTALLTLLLALGTFYIAMSLSGLRRSSYLLPWMREFLADFGPMIALGAMSIVAFNLDEVFLDTLQAPDQFGTTSGRPWLVDLWAAPPWLRLAAAAPGLLIAVLIYLVQNITARLVNSPDHKLRHGHGYHLDLAVLAGLTGLCSLFGLPWFAAATVRSLNHVRSLATFEEVARPGSSPHERIIHVRENRLTGIAIHGLIACALLLLPYLRYVPLAVLYGVFLFMGVVSMAGNQFFERLSLWVKDPDLYPMTHYIRRAPIWVIHSFTGVQFVCLAVLWVVNLNKNPAISILFPMFVALLVPVRFALNRFYKRPHLEALDAAEEPEDEATHWAA
ncbi:Nitrogen regulatory protein [Posidoniimonas corsicana]|uniref:Nitrogen regulatory protein n=1 Tax=Posidoniimonas corsicana TaxID=1938618 RepID=A0A5C5VIF5_9BACT|nr:PTS sugar transporter subunit IIA [Posidoniimonas corsicana]TWT37545.1 Nitrogen regulatory protein [Posidoniimonas corsicana]